MRKALKHCWLRPRPVFAVQCRRLLTTSYAKGPSEVWAKFICLFRDLDVDIASRRYLIKLLGSILHPSFRSTVIEQRRLDYKLLNIW